jgi:octaprenyl-diphosphate synthase
VKFFSAARTKVDPARQAQHVLSLVGDELALVEEEYRRQASSNIQVIDYLGDYLQSSGGKRVRPALLILANYAVGGNARSENVIRLATVMEMLHTATLVHDDIIDNADLRRNRQSVNARFGNQTAVLMGDWLYMSAFETSLRERSLRVLDILTGLTRKMTEGELLQLTSLGSTDISKEAYFDILRRKTAYLFSACCEIGAILGGAAQKASDALRDYGLNLGIAFQLADDLLDFTADAAILGKASGADLTEGKLTLPLILLRDKRPEVVKGLETVMSDGNYDRIPRDHLLDMLQRDGAIEATRESAKEYANAARKNLDVLPETEYREALGDLPAFVIERNR